VHRLTLYFWHWFILAEHTFHWKCDSVAGHYWVWWNSEWVTCLACMNGRLLGWMGLQTCPPDFELKPSKLLGGLFCYYWKMRLGIFIIVRPNRWKVCLFNYLYFILYGLLLYIFYFIIYFYLLFIYLSTPMFQL
jgi:hypothetical protein